MKNIKLVFVLIFILCLLEGLLTSISITSIIPILSTLNENESDSNFFLKDLIGRFYLEFEDLIITSDGGVDVAKELRLSVLHI